VDLWRRDPLFNECLKLFRLVQACVTATISNQSDSSELPRPFSVTLRTELNGSFSLPPRVLR
jgi:hypothetical protein